MSAAADDARVLGRPLPLRPDRVYVGWQYALLHPHPGPQPRRPTPPEREQLNPDWVAAQQREEGRLDRPPRLAGYSAAAVAAALVASLVLGWLNPALAGLGIVVCLAGAAQAIRTIRQGEQAVRARVAAERDRVERIRALQEKRLFEWQAQHARHATEWQGRRAAYEEQMQWYAVSLPSGIDRLDVAGGTQAGWSAMLAMAGIPRLETGGEVTVVDISEGAAATDLLAVARHRGIEPLVSVLPHDLARVDLGAGLGQADLADLLSLVVGASDERAGTSDLARDNALLDRVIGVLGGDVTIAQVVAALRVLAHIGDPRADERRGLLTQDQIGQLSTLFGRGADQMVVERAWTLESQLRKLESAGSAAVASPPTRLRVISTDRRAGVLGNKVLGTYVVAALTHLIRHAPVGEPWQHTVFLLGAEKLRGDVLDRLADACEATRTGLVLAYRSIPAGVMERLGRGNAAVAFMRLGNAADAKAAREHIGTDQRFVLSQLTDTVGTSVADSAGESYTSTVGSSGSVSRSASTTTTSGRSRGRGASSENGFLPLSRGTRSSSTDTSQSVGGTDTEAVTEGISSSTAWGISTSKAVTGSESLGRTMQRSREFLVEQHELQQLPPSAMILSYSSAGGRRIVVADANPGIFGLPTATLATLDEVRRDPQAALAARTAAPYAARPGQPPERAGATAPDAARTPADEGTEADGEAGALAGGGRGTGTGADGDLPEGADGEPGTGPGSGAGGGTGTDGAEADGQAGQGTGPRPVPVNWRSGEGRPPPNLGPPPERLDWRRPRDE